MGRPPKYPVVDGRKTCSKCLEPKAITEFYVLARGGYTAQCKTCLSVQTREWHKNNPEATDRAMVRYRQRHREALGERRRSPERRQYQREYQQQRRAEISGREVDRKYDAIRRGTKPKPGFLYAITVASGMIKIGRTSNVEARMAQYRRHGAVITHTFISRAVADAGSAEWYVMHRLLTEGGERWAESREWFTNITFAQAVRAIEEVLTKF